MITGTHTPHNHGEENPGDRAQRDPGATEDDGSATTSGAVRGGAAMVSRILVAVVVVTSAVGSAVSALLLAREVAGWIRK